MWLGLAAAGAAQGVAPSADLVAGIAAYNKGDFAAAFRLLQVASARGEAEAMVNLGYLYARGHGVARDPDAALRLYFVAARDGDGEAMNAVGYRYAFANPPDYVRAVQWFCKAIGQGNTRALNNLGGLVRNGQGVPADVAEARGLWAQAVARGHPNAQANLGQDLMTDAALAPAEREKGLGMLRRAALEGNAAAQEVLRRAGDTEDFPPVSNSDLTMRLEPRPGVPGHARVCGDLIS